MADGDQVLGVAAGGEELGEEAGLPDAGVAFDRDGADWRQVAGLVDGVAELGEFGVAADEAARVAIPQPDVSAPGCQPLSGSVASMLERSPCP